MKNVKPDNPFIAILTKAKENNWCTNFFCTTCGAHEFRKALKVIGGPSGGGLVKALKEIDVEELTDLENWKDPILIALFDLPFTEQRDEVLKVWMPASTNHLDFTDFIVFKALGLLPINNETKKKWIEKCIEIVLDTHDFSLTESLILMLGRDAKNYPRLLEIAGEYAKTSAQMKRVLINTNNMWVK